MPAGGLAARTEALLARHWWRERASWLAWLLSPLAFVYRLLEQVQRRSAGRPQPLPVPVVVVGNVIVGGAGKTPTVIALVQALEAAGHRVGVVSRGWGRRSDVVAPVLDHSTAAEVGDEPLLIHRRCRVPVWVGQRRAAAVRALCARHPSVDVVVSDDGLQHSALARQAAVVVFDDRGTGNGRLIPAGPLRVPLPEATGRGLFVLYTGTRQSTALPGAFATRRLTRALPLQAWRAGDSAAAVELARLRGRPLLAAAGLAHPEKFFAMLEAEGLEIDRQPLPDHFDYAGHRWPAGTGDVVTTEKDAVKLDASHARGVRVWVVPLDFELPPSIVGGMLALLFPHRSP